MFDMKDVQKDISSVKKKNQNKKKHAHTRHLASEKWYKHRWENL